MKKSILKIVVLLLVMGLNWAGLLAVGKTLAYFNDTENSLGNSYEASSLDFALTNRYKEGFIGMEALSEIEFASVVMKKTGSLNIQYEVNVEKISGDDDFCNALQIELEHNGIEEHDGSLVSVSVPVTTDLGTWEFELDLPVSASYILHGAECNIDLVFKAWRLDTLNFEDSGFSDEERIELRLKSRMIVLNEFLPKPNGEAYGFDFGDDNSDMPRGEWVELYNNSDVEYSLDGWYIWDDSGNSDNKIYIDLDHTSGTTISGKGWLVVYMNKEVLDNAGDTVKLFNGEDVLVDSYIYSGHNHCEIEPTPGEENSDTFGGTSCGDVPDNKSYARLPDGTGYWVDPIPTPGGPNINDNNNYSLLQQQIEPKDDITFSELVEEFMSSNGGTGEEESFDEIVEEIVEDIIVELSVPDIDIPDIDIIETTTPSTEEVIVMEEPAFTEVSVDEEEPIIEEEPEPEPLPAEAPSGAEEGDPEPPLESSQEDQTGQAEPLKESDPEPEPEPEPEPDPEPDPEPEPQPEPEPEPELNNNDNIENEENI